MAPERRQHLLVSSLRQRAVLEANTHYGGDLSQGIAGELTSLADVLEAEVLPGRSGYRSEPVCEHSKPLGECWQCDVAVDNKSEDWLNDT